MKRITGKIRKKENKEHHILRNSIIILILVVIIFAFILLSCKIKKIEIVIDYPSENISKETESIENSENIKNYKITEEEIKSLLNVNINDNMYKTSKNSIINSIKQNPYVQDVIIKRNLNRSS